MVSIVFILCSESQIRNYLKHEKNYWFSFKLLHRIWVQIKEKSNYSYKSFVEYLSSNSKKVMKVSQIVSPETGPPDGVPDVVEPQKSRKGLTEEDKQKMKKFFIGGIPAMIGGQLFAIGYIALVLSDWIDFSKSVNTRVEELVDIQSRIGYVLRYSTPGVMWIIRCMFAVMLRRSLSPAMDPSAGAEHHVQNAKNILNNSFEQFVLALVSQLILVQHINPEQTLKYIPALALLFVIGRVTFWLGYPRYRLFGFLVNLIPLLLTMGFNSYKSWEYLFWPLTSSQLFNRGCLICDSKQSSIIIY